MVPICEVQSSLMLSGAITTNLIRPDGHISGLDLGVGQHLIVRDYHGNYSFSPGSPPVPITVDSHVAISNDGTLQLVFDAAPWDSLISFSSGISVSLGGTLSLTFAPDVDLASQVGRSIQIFNWNGVTPTGTFTLDSLYAWDLSQLYSAGIVTLTAPPSLPGDFNADGRVDASDYIVWCNGLGSTFTQADYDVWCFHSSANPSPRVRQVTRIRPSPNRCPPHC